MKLKKIASLMLAGVMAVSMLAGCSTGSNGGNNGNGGEGEGEGTATGYSAMLGQKAADTLSKNDLEDVFTFADCADDQKALKKVIVNDVTEKDVTGVINSVTVKGAWTFQNADIKAVDAAFTTEVSGNNGIGNMNNDPSVNTETYANVWVANGNIAMDTVIGKVFDDVKSFIAAAKKDDTVASVADVNYTYTVSVSVVNVPVTYDTTTSGSLNFVGVKVTRAAELA